MKKSLFFSLVSFSFILLNQQVKADWDSWGYKFPESNSKIDIYTFNSDDGSETLRNSYCFTTIDSSSCRPPTDSFINQSTGNYVLQYNGPVNGITKYYLVEYDLENNSFQKTEISNSQKAYNGVKSRLQLLASSDGTISDAEGTKIIQKKSDGSVHIGPNSAVFKEENGREKFWAQDANGKSIPIDITNGSKLLINGRDVEQSINNVGALSAALTGLPTVPTDTTLACGLGSGTHGGDFAFSGGCASKVNDKLSINYAASMTMPGQEYAGDFEDKFSARAGFVWKLGKSTKPSQISIKEKDELKQEISDLKANNKKIISQNKALLARIERLEKIALSATKSKDLATIKLP